MGINQESLGLILKTLDDHMGRNCRMVELGNQVLKGEDGRKAAKGYFESIGIDHTSIDINGKDGALTIDLTKEIKTSSLIGMFDVLTNFGTTEHVKEQYPCWLNIHNLVRQGGIFMHCVPQVGSWKRHGYFKYDFEFFETISKHCKYEILKLGVRRVPKKNLVMGILKKRENNQFMPPNDFKLYMGL